MSSAEQRQAVADLATAALREMERLWGRHGADARMFREVLPLLAREYGSAAASLASDWYLSRRARAGVAGLFAPRIASLPGPERWDSLVGWAFATGSSESSVMTLIGGGLQRTIANQHRGTVTASSIADPKARGWRRVGSGVSCDFCQMLLGRGAVYIEETADFATHDHCNCSAEPDFG